MKKRRWIYGLLAVGALALTPFRSSDVAELIPVETLVVYEDGSQLVIDGGKVLGRGANWREAWQDLQHGAPGKVFLGTAEDVVLVGGAVKRLPEMIQSEILRPAARVCCCPGNPPEMEQTNAYLTVQEDGLTLQQVHAAMLEGKELQLPVLLQTKGGLRLYGASDG